MRLATFNVENMFERAAIMNLPTWAEGRAVLEDFSNLNDLINKERYSNEDKAKMLDALSRHKGLVTTGKSKYLRLRDIRGNFIKKPRDGPVEIVAGGRGDWIGWFELEKEPIKETATENTARVIRELAADVLCVVEAENRTMLKRFNEALLPKLGGQPYDHVMLIDGNDDRGIDVGIMTRKDFPVQHIASHVDDADAKGIIFSRDCPEYVIQTAAGNRLLALINHFKSKGYGPASASNDKRMRQAKRVREIYEARIQEGNELIAIAGDLNDAPDTAGPLDPLLKDSGLIDVMSHPDFIGDGRPGTHGNGTKDAKFDYILMSPELQRTVRKAGIERRGVWGGKNGTLFPHLREIKSAKDAASDHAALWVDIDI
jgi:endonuclease/exonuclease/phosphatase family metal-dependent hydrolase